MDHGPLWALRNKAVVTTDHSMQPRSPEIMAIHSFFPPSSSGRRVDGTKGQIPDARSQNPASSAICCTIPTGAGERPPSAASLIRVVSRGPWHCVCESMSVCVCEPVTEIPRPLSISIGPPSPPSPPRWALAGALAQRRNPTRCR
jgi:hypothetical protein